MFSVMTAARASVGARTEFGSSSRWIDRWLAACHDLAELERSNPMTDAVVEEIDGRMIRIGDQWLADFASCNYIGFDLDREIIDSVAPALDRWGTHPSWSRLLGSPVLYEQIEERLTELVGAEDVAKLKEQVAGEILVAGSAMLVRALVENDLVDELRLMVFPTVLGGGKRLFGESASAKTFGLVESRPVGDDGVVILTYEPAKS